ncbi:MAG TPA: response regulator transcription factor [Bryobacteraceae bacterium]|nr:response regulator transcription factor [Bryobacteraceae bacterium]
MVRRVLLIDSHKLVRDGIHVILERSGQFRVEAEADNSNDALQIARQSSCDLAVLGVEAVGLPEQELTRQLVENCSLPVIVLSSRDDEHSVVAALRSGASAYLLKQVSAGEFLDALHRVAEDGSYLGPQVHEHLIAHIRRGDSGERLTSSGSFRLTPRELEVLRLVTDGHASVEISHMLGLSVATVRSYRKSVMKKLGVNHVAALIQIAVREGLTRWTHSASGSYT